MLEQNGKMNDYDKYSFGLMKQKDTWWGKKIEANAERVRSGEFGEVVDERKVYDGWGDGLKVPQFVVLKDGKARVLKVSESGIFEACESGGSVNVGI